jgi:hypothetical protein
MIIWEISIQSLLLTFCYRFLYFFYLLFVKRVWIFTTVKIGNWGYACTAPRLICVSMTFMVTTFNGCSLYWIFVNFSLIDLSIFPLEALLLIGIFAICDLFDHFLEYGIKFGAIVFRFGDLLFFSHLLHHLSDWLLAYFHKKTKGWIIEYSYYLRLKVFRLHFNVINFICPLQFFLNWFK